MMIKANGNSEDITQGRAIPESTNRQSKNTAKNRENFQGDFSGLVILLIAHVNQWDRIAGHLRQYAVPFQDRLILDEFFG